MPEGLDSEFLQRHTISHKLLNLAAGHVSAMQSHYHFTVLAGMSSQLHMSITEDISKGVRTANVVRFRLEE